MKRRAVPLQPPEKLDQKGLKLSVRKGTEIVHLWFPRNTHSLMKWIVAPSQPPEIIYFCKFRPKRTWNYTYLACKIIFLGREAPPPCNHIRKYFDRKGPEIVHLWFPRTRNIHSLIKRTAAPCYHQKLYISGGHKEPPEIIYFCKFRPKEGLKLCVNSLQIRIFR